MSISEKLAFLLAFLVWLSSMVFIAYEEGYLETTLNLPKSGTSEPLLKPGTSTLAIFRINRSGKEIHAGETTSTTTILEDNSAIVTTRTNAELKLLSYVPVKFDSTMQVIFDTEGNLAQFSHTLSTNRAKNLNIQIEGMRQDNRIHFTVSSNASVIYQDSFPIKGNLSVGSGLLPVGQFKDPEKFKSWPINYINPITKKSEKGVAEVTGKKEINIGKQVFNTYKIEISFADNSYLKPVAYITRDGELIELRGIAGYIFRKQVSRRKAIKNDKD